MVELKAQTKKAIDAGARSFNRSMVELKDRCYVCGREIKGGFNRSMVELKDVILPVSLIYKPGSFNRSMVELKVDEARLKEADINCFNRSMVELKDRC